MAWTKFYDMRSGGGQKEEFGLCFIEAPQAEAEVIFFNRFGHNPNRVTCTCCGPDYSIDDEDGETLESITQYYREPASWRSDPQAGPVTVEQMIETKRTHDGTVVEFIFAADIKPEERVGDVPEQGYVWK